MMKYDQLYIILVISWFLCLCVDDKIGTTSQFWFLDIFSWPIKESTDQISYVAWLSQERGECS